MPQFFYGGRFWNTPAGIRQLQFNQLRSHLYPRDPYLAAQAMDEYGQPVPEYLPQRMMFTRWKTPPMRAAWLENAIGFMAAKAQGPAHAAALEQASGLPPTMPFWDMPQALGANNLPQPDMTPEPAPISRGVLPPSRMHLQPHELEALGNETMAHANAGSQGVQNAKDRAMAEVQGLISSANQAVYGGTAENEPWFLRR